MPDNQETEVDRLQDIIDTLPDMPDHLIPEGQKRREYSLTQADVMVIYRIARVANAPHVCPFENEEQETLVSVAKNINRTQKIASVVIITSLVGGMLASIWAIVKMVISDFIKTGGFK